MNNKILNYILSLIGVLITIHYFFSLYLLEVYLGKYKLSTMSIISWEDIQFYFALLDFYVFRNAIFASSTFITIFVIINMHTKRHVGFRGTRYKQYKSQGFFKKITFQKLLLIMIIGVILIVFITYALHSLSYGNLDISLGVLALFIVATWMYYIFRKMDIIILGVIFVTTASIYGKLIKEGSNLHSNDIKLKLDSGEFVESDSINRLVFLGTKYIIIENDSPNVKLYPTEKIKEIEWIEKTSKGK